MLSPLLCVIFLFTETHFINQQNSLRMKQFYSKILLGILFILGNESIHAQVSTYSFSASAGTYTPISVGGGATLHSSGSAMDDATFSVTLPFTFTYDGQAYTQVWVSENGYVAFGATDPGTTNRSIISSTYAGRAFAAYSGDLGGVNASSNCMSQVIGVSPNRSFVAQWSGISIFLGTAQIFNFQLILNEANGVALNQTLQSVYSSMTTTGASTAQQVGLRGLTSAAFNNRKNTVSLNWTSPEAGTFNTDAMTVSTTVFPASGQTYTWTPPPPCTIPGNQPSALVLTPINAGQINGSFTAAPSTPQGYLIVRYPMGGSPTNPVNGVTYTTGGALGTGTIVQSGTTTSFSAIGLSPLTTYDFYVYSMNQLCTGGPLYLTAGPLMGSAATPAPTPPACATTFTPLNAAVNVPIAQVLSWSGATGFPAITGYHVYFSTNSALVTSEDVSVRVSTNQAGLTYTPVPALLYGTTYYWKIVPINSVGPSVGCAVNSFTTYVPTNITSTNVGGLWNSAATWAGGVVPVAGDNVTIADGAIVSVDVLVNGIGNLTVGQGSSGILQWSSTTFAMTLFGNLTINPGGKFYPHTSGGTGQTINIGGNLVNNGFGNLAVPSTLINFNGSQQGGGSLNQNFSGGGTLAGNGLNGIVRALFFQTTGSSSITTARTMATTSFGHTAGTLTTNGLLSIDNTVQIYGQPFNQQVASIAVTNMGTAYSSAPVIFGAVVSAWTASGAAVVGTRYYSGGNVYICTVAGTFDGVTPPTHLSGIVVNGSASLLWLAPYGTLGNPFLLTAAVVGTQYFYGGNLYICTVAGIPDPTNPPVHFTGIVASGAASYLYAGTPALVTGNYDATTQTLRSLNLVSAGTGYSSVPSVTINGGGGTGAAATATFFQSILGTANSLTQRSGSATIVGTLDINSTQGASSQSGVGGITTTNGGVNYTIPPTVGFAGPPALNLVTAGGSGFATAPTITVTAAPGTLISGSALTTANFTITVNQGSVVSVYLNTGTTATYSTPPALSFTGGGGMGATLEFPAGCWPAATAIIGSNRQITDFILSNAGFGYAAAPTVGVGTVSGSVEGGTFTTVATAPTCRIGLYNLSINNFTPSPANIPAVEDAAFPPTRKFNTLLLGSSSSAIGNFNLSGPLELFGTAPLTLTGGVLNLGGNNLLCTWNGYAGQAGTVTANVTNGSITLTTRGGGLTGSTLNYPFDATFTTFTGTGATVAGGASVLKLTVSRTAAPSGAGAIGSRAYRVIPNSGAVYGTNPTVTLNWNANDALVSDQAGLFVSQSAASSGPWTTRSLTSGTVALGLAATGSRVTTTTMPTGPIVPTGDDYYAWTSTFVPTPLNYSVVRNTSITYTSIMATGLDLPWGTAGSVSNDDITASISLTSITGGTPTFVYQGQPITGFSMCSNGWIKLNSATSPSTSLTSFSNQLALIPNLLAPFWEDLSTNPNLGSQAGDLARLQASMKYQVNGTVAGSRQFIVEWKNMTVFGAGGPQLSFQIVLDETNNSITFNYGLFQGFNGTNNHRYTYSVGLAGTTVSANPLAGQVMALQYENTTAFSHEYASSANLGANALLSMPVCNTALVYTPGAYGGFSPPAQTPPANDEAAGAITVTSLSSFPSNLCGNFYTSRFATASVQSVCGGNNDDDVWFKFTANEANTTVRVYGSGGYVPRVQVLNAALNPLSPAQCVVGSAGGTSIDAVLLGLTIGNLYYIRVYHDGGGTQAIGSIILNPTGQIAFITPTNGGSGYTSTTTGTTLNTRIRLTGGGGRDGAASATLTGGVVTAITIGNAGYGYTSAPTVTIEKPNWAHNGEFALVVYAPAANDECAGAKQLTNLTNTDCTLSQNSLNDITSSATASAESPVCGTPDDDVWFKFTAINAFTHIDVIGTGSFDAAFEVFNGGVMPGACAGKTSIGCFNVNGAGAIDSITTATIVGNTYFVRVYHAGAGTVTGESFNICVNSAPPACVVSPLSPANGSGLCTSPATLNWAAVSGASAYDVYFDPGAGPATTLVSTQVTTSYMTGVLSAGTYSWRIVPKNIFGSASGCSTFTFTLEGTVVTSQANSGGGSLRSVYGCIADGGTITYNHPMGVDTSFMTAVLNINKNVTILGNVADSTKVLIDFQGSMAQGLSIDALKTLTLQSINVNGGAGVTSTIVNNGSLKLNAATINGTNDPVVKNNSGSDVEVIMSTGTSYIKQN